MSDEPQFVAIVSVLKTDGRIARREICRGDEAKCRAARVKEYGPLGADLNTGKLDVLLANDWDEIKRKGLA